MALFIPLTLLLLNVMAKKTKKNTVVKKAVKAAKSVKKSKPAPAKPKAGKAKAKARPVKPAAKKSNKPVTKKAVKPAAKASKTVAKKNPAKGNNKVIAKASSTKNSKTTSKAKAKTKAVKKASPAKPAKAAKPVKNTRPAKPVKPVKAAGKKKVAASKTVKAAPAAKPAEASRKKNSVAGKEEVKTKPVNGASPKAEAKNKKLPVSKNASSKPLKDEEEDIPVDEVPELVDTDIPDEAADVPEDIAPAAPVKAKGKGRVNGKGKSAQTGPRVITAPITPPKPQIMPADKKKEPKGRFEMEYVVHASAYLLFEFLTTPSGLSEWFADDVNIRQGIYTFFWDGSEQQAKLIGYKDAKLARFQWLDKNDGSYFEFRIDVDDLTGDVSLIITDFAEDPAEMATTKLLWDSQVNKLLHVIGAYY